MLVGADARYLRRPFDNEAEIEKVVIDQAELLFGTYAIVLSQTQITTGGGKATVPDGIAIDLLGQEWYLIEAERGIHGTWEHIAPQVSRQLAAASTAATRERILGLAIEQVRSSSE